MKKYFYIYNSSHKDLKRQALSVWVRMNKPGASLTQKRDSEATFPDAKQL